MYTFAGFLHSESLFKVCPHSIITFFVADGRSLFVSVFPPIPQHCHAAFLNINRSLKKEKKRNTVCLHSVIIQSGLWLISKTVASKLCIFNNSCWVSEYKEKGFSIHHCDTSTMLLSLGELAFWNKKNNNSVISTCFELCTGFNISSLIPEEPNSDCCLWFQLKKDFLLMPDL